MKQVGHRQERPLLDQPSGERLVEGARFSEAVAALGYAGFPKGVYRYRTHAEANQHEAECLAQAMA
ncbi:MAG: hypothetical protein ACOYLV_16880, partial [Rubrivivax sp.]